MSRPNDPKTMAEILRQKIRDCGQSLPEIARGAGIAKPVLWRFVRAERDLTSRTCDKLLRYFGLSLQPQPKEED